MKGKRLASNRQAFVRTKAFLSSFPNDPVESSGLDLDPEVSNSMEPKTLDPRFKHSGTTVKGK